MVQVGRGEVDVRAEVLREARDRLPAAGLGDGVPEHPVADFHGEAALVGGVEEGIRRQQAQGRVAPADQGLGAGDPAGAQVHDRLVLQFELVGGQRRPEFCRQVDPLLGGLVHGLGKHQEVVPAAFLRLVHGNVGVAEEFIAPSPGSPNRTPPAAVSDRAMPPARILSFSASLSRAASCSTAVRVRVHDEHGELIAAEAGDDRCARLRPRRLQPQGRLPQDGVAGGVAQAVVDQPEGIQVEEDEGRLGARFGRRPRRRTLFPAAASGWPGRSARRYR